MHSEKTKIDLVSDLEVRMIRKFDAPRALIWEALSNPDYVRQWYGLRILKMTACEIDHRVGGRWRFVLLSPDGSEHVFSGKYLQIRKPEFAVHTENYEPLGPGHEITVTTTLSEVQGHTTLTSKLVYRSKADRDGHLQSGMEIGANESHDRLSQILETISRSAG